MQIRNRLFHFGLAFALSQGAAMAQVSGTPRADAGTQGVLFFGNSYTNYNNLPDMVAALPR
ncbi:MAG: hypothetical protein HY854_04035 [Burkholderiales bacterium]|nr:hypothetical protein [Burkholderiales bacterium]